MVDHRTKRLTTQTHVDAMAEKHRDEVRTAYLAELGGVSACSPSTYEASLLRIAMRVGRQCDDSFRSLVREIERGLPCPID